MITRLLVILGSLAIAGWVIAGMYALTRIPTRQVGLDHIQVVTTNIVRRVTLNGGVVPGERSIVYAPVPLRALNVSAKLGQLVRSGQILATLDCRAIDLEEIRRELALARAEAAVVKARDVESSEGGASRDGLELRIKTLEVREAQAELERVQSIRKHCVLTSPQTGELVTIGARKGEIVPASGQGAPAFVIASTDTMFIDAEADEIDAVGIQVGQRVLVFIDALGLGRPLVGSVAAAPILRRAPSVLTGPAVFGVSVKVEERLNGVRIGSTARLEVETGVANQVLAVPVAAILTTDTGNFVIQILADGSHKAVPVRVGVSDNQFSAIDANLEAGQRVLLGEATRLRDALTHIRSVEPE